MFPEAPDSSVPFLQHPDSLMKSTTAVCEEPSELGSLKEGPASPHRSSFNMRTFLPNILWGWPALVIWGQILLQGSAWIFFAVVESRGAIALPHRTAAWAQIHTREVTLISTLLSTALAACSSFLFSFGVGRSIALRLRQPLSLAVFVSTVGIAKRSLVLQPRQWKWTAMSMGVIILTGVQTSAWSTFLTPVGIVIQTPVSGSEIDLRSPILHQMQSSGSLDFCIQESGLQRAFEVGLSESGYALVKNNMSYPGSFDLMDHTFNVSTAGILPTTLVSVDSTGWFEATTPTVIPSTVQGLDDLPSELSANYSMVQQGFSIDVNCALQNLTPSTSPQLVYSTDTVKDWDRSGITSNITLVQMWSNCTVTKIGLNVSYAYIVPGGSYILMIACPSAEDYVLIIASEGSYYLPTTVCTLSPKITTVKVEYSDPRVAHGTIGTTTLADGAVPDLGGPTGLAAVGGIKNTLFLSQGLETNSMGAFIHEILTEASISVGVTSSAETTLKLGLIAEYVRGVAEFSGSVFRGCLSERNGTFIEGVPANMTIPMVGTAFIQTMGWTRLGPSSLWVLVPGTLVALVTIIVVVASVAQCTGDPLSNMFDPSNAMHLVEAAAAGGLHEKFTGTSGNRERVSIVLGTIPGRGPALVRSPGL
ncbi:hypothetical protein B0H17DRAFT_1111929 [Mycena rosella]|uniref:Uncharacterized protein n=1 Tax=Mycena rosella TaxID=1033263 RepID=A0AAD7FHC4_MYCRO|nr:hypothetical protein B0H17DRAFT_1111929 [Mycena rosella]